MPVDRRLLASLPLLRRDEVQRDPSALHARVLPPGHAPVHDVESSGSTGSPVKSLGTPITRLFWFAFALRAHEWWRRDFSARSAVITFLPHLPPGGGRRADWGPPVSWLYPCGPSFAMHVATPVDEQARWLMRVRPRYLVTHPTNAEALARWFLEHGERLEGLREVNVEELPARTRQVLA